MLREKTQSKGSQQPDCIHRCCTPIQSSMVLRFFLPPSPSFFPPFLLFSPRTFSFFSERPAAILAHLLLPAASLIHKFSKCAHKGSLANSSLIEKRLHRPPLEKRRLRVILPVHLEILVIVVPSRLLGTNVVFEGGAKMIERCCHCARRIQKQN